MTLIITDPSSWLYWSEANEDYAQMLDDYEKELEREAFLEHLAEEVEKAFAQALRELKESEEAA